MQEQQSNLPSTVAWPPAGETPINEFRTEGYISCAFPTLFPTGAADFVAPRACAVTIGNYFKHFLMYEDRRFARHLRFCYFALNTEMRWCALQTGRIYARQRPQDAQLSVEELRDMVGHEGEAFATVCCTLLAAYEGQGNTGSSSGVGSLPWWTPLVYPLSSSHTVQLISSGQSWHISSAPMILIPVPAAAEQRLRTQPLQTGSSITAFRSSSMPSMLFLVSQTTGCTGCTSRSACACASIAFELTLAPTMLCIHLVILLHASKGLTVCD